VLDDGERRASETTLAAKRQRTRVLGIDPGSRKTGWGVIDVLHQERKLVHVDNGALFLDTKADLSARLLELSRALAQVIETHRPTCSAVEDVYVAKGARSALILGQARGAAVATLGLHGLTVESHTAAQVKARVTGRGRASKEQVAEMVCVLLGLPEHPFEDAADALAVAVCHAMTFLGPEVMARAASTTGAKPAKARKGRAGLADLARAQGKI
jgi:crossover junction endodeoxyribonuclease RuvC